MARTMRGLTGVLNLPAGQASATSALNPIDNPFEEAARIVTITLTANTRPFTLVAGRMYRVESSPDLRQWSTFVFRTNHYGTPLLINAASVAVPCRFFRASQVPLNCADQ